MCAILNLSGSRAVVVPAVLETGTREFDSHLPDHFTEVFMFKFKEDSMNVPAFIYQERDAIEDGAIQQVKNMASLPFTFHHVAAMPDCHYGYGMPIGGVLATQGVVIPNAVGVDIGCGVVCVKTSIRADQLSNDRLKEIMSSIRKEIPVGFNKHKKSQEMPQSLMNFSYEDIPICYKNFDNATKQLGTLGGGNHFIEIQKGDDGFVYFMIHSGSRNLGFQVAKHYNDLAIKLNKQMYSSVSESYELAFLPMGTDVAKSYLREMEYCLNFAKANREAMVDKVKESFLVQPCIKCSSNGGNCEMFAGNGRLPADDVEFEEITNIHHNYAAMESHFSKNVMVHRKGATRARNGEIGLIPGSQGTSSYIVRGKGNEESFCSCSHGAGRKMSRSKARKELNMVDEIEILNQQGIIHSIRGKSSLDEAPSAYKNIDQVMAQQQDLVDVVMKLTPLGVIKG